MRGLARLVPAAVISVRTLLVATLLAGAMSVAEARGGFFELFGDSFGGDSQPLPQPDWIPSDSPPLTVRAKPRRHRSLSSRRGAQHYNVADLKGVTIYTDRTLSRGDAVMTASGLKVFNGSQSWPHTEDDFVAIAESGKLSSGLRKELTAIDNASKPEFAR